MSSGAVAFRQRLSADDVLESVFPRSEFSTPTPESTPMIGTLSSPSRAFGGFNNIEDVADATLRLSQAWSTATRFLRLQDEHGRETRSTRPSQDARTALLFLTTSLDTRKDLLIWYCDEVARHFRAFILPNLLFWQHPVPLANANKVINKTVEVLQLAQSRYLGDLQAISADLSADHQDSGVGKFLRQVQTRLHSTISHAFPSQTLEQALSAVLYSSMQHSLIEESNPEKCLKAGSCRCNVHLGSFPLLELCDVGLGGRTGQQAFAQAIYKLLHGPALERRCFHVDWTGRDSVVANVQQWVEGNFSKFIEATLAVLLNTPGYQLPHNDQADLVRAAVNSLGRQRTSMLFDYVNRWPASEGAVRDIREYIMLGGPGHKALVCSSFSNQVHQRLLHSGASTVEILSIYINVIHTFRALDARGVMLEKVAGPIRSYLRSRDDTVNTIAASLLAEVDVNGVVKAVDSLRVCAEIPAEIERSAIAGRQEEPINHWGDMNWVPDPIDAGPDYKSSRSEDVVTYILGLFEQDDFINEVRSVLATHLMESDDPEFVRETRLVELLKARLDATKLQAIEVMLKDVRDSVAINRRLNFGANIRRNIPPTPQEVRDAIPAEGISLPSLYRAFEGRIRQPQLIAIVNTVAVKRQDLLFPKRTRARLPAERRQPAQGDDDFRVQIISKSFWPDLSNEEFVLPASLEKCHNVFEQRFAQLGGQRKLFFRPALGRVNVDLEFEDRALHEQDVQVWKASVIDAFTTATEDADVPTTFTIEELSERLKMDEDLVSTAISFWVGRKALYQPTKGTYAVLERLEMESEAVDTDMQPGDDDISAVRSQMAMLQASAPMFCTFISHMLRNAGPKEVEGMMGITNMLKMVCPMFTHGDEEVRWLLCDMEGRGEVSRNGEIWTIVDQK